MFGFPTGGDTLSMTTGIVSRIEHQFYAHSYMELFAIQVDAAINAGNSGGQLYVKINGTQVAYDGPGADLTDATWQMWSIDLSTVGNVSNVSSLVIGIEGAGAAGVVYIDDIRLYP